MNIKSKIKLAKSNFLLPSKTLKEIIIFSKDDACTDE